jgi:hypothetical protein
MNMHMLAFGANALDASAGNVQLVAIAEQVFSRSGGNNFQIPDPLKIVGMVGAGAGLTSARINTGSLRTRGFPHIFPMIGALGGTFQNLQFMNLLDYPIDLRKEEDFRIDVTNGGVALTFVLAWVTQDAMNRNINSVGLRWIRFTYTTTDAIAAWSAPATIAFEDTLEGGLYNIYGMNVVDNEAFAARLILQNQVYRPGCLANAAITSEAPFDLSGNSGVWGQFNTYSPPQIETLGRAAAGTAASGLLLVGKA